MHLNNLLNMLKNAVVRKDNSVSLKSSKQTINLVKFLSKNGFIRGFEISKGQILVFLKFDNYGNSALNALWLVPRFKPAPLTASKKQMLLRSFSVPLSLSTAFRQSKKMKFESGTCLGILR